MILLFSPTKQMVSGILPHKVPASFLTQPRFHSEAVLLNDALSEYGPDDLARLMKTSPVLTAKTAELVREFSGGPKIPAILAYRGTSFLSLEAENLTLPDLEYAQNHLRILSGMYGSLRPLDQISPYRLEMKTILKTDGCCNLYEFWKERINGSLAAETVLEPEDSVCISLASEEYSRIVSSGRLKRRIITLNFKEKTSAGFRTVGMYAKQARGAMLRRILQEKVSNFMNIKELRVGNYEYCSSLSNNNRWVFIRG